MARVLTFLADGEPDVRVAHALTAPVPDHAGAFDTVISVLPFNMRTPDHLHLASGGRFRFGAPSRTADLLLVQHAISLLDANGRAALVVPRGPLFRSGAEAEVRRGLIEADLIDAVIALPPGLLSSTSLPIVVLVLGRDRPAARKGRTLFVRVGAARERLKDLSQPVVDSVLRLVREYRDHDTEDCRARVVSASELRAAEYSLDPNRFFEDEASETLAPDAADLAREVAELRAAEESARARTAGALANLVAAGRG
ncbi:Type I restriction-modification system, DNA-methyltransferase subunit M [Sandaracinus amylolyticus]|uniref:site-specific DNA-methyltransferase (adenine-specific) n=2 Tax=Sandaracinus amylolyticus TaxID=927083 RepID=A0A0F6SH88_9BACT|nr:Type I restriction-modification system, DNA-methyltransferase subunit M [Sandaracinus amylolyticus]